MTRPSKLVSFAEHNINRRTINGDLRPSMNTLMLSVIGNPRGHYDQMCRNPTDPRIAAMMATSDVGPFRATGMKIAVRALQDVFRDVKTEHPEVHAALSSAGMLCCRLVRNSTSAISNHSWGTAIDLMLDGKLDPPGDGKTQIGLLKIAPIFNKHGFFWGAAFSNEDAMHFEASAQLIQRWADDGEFGKVAASPAGMLSFGDRGPAVEELQQQLNLILAVDIAIDGVFGKDTRAAVMEFQRRSGLFVDGIVGPKTTHALDFTGGQRAA